ncbi:hypothetical protein D3C73_939490 [compost metagenome]
MRVLHTVLQCVPAFIKKPIEILNRCFRIFHILIEGYENIRWGFLVYTKFSVLGRKGSQWHRVRFRNVLQQILHITVNPAADSADQDTRLALRPVCHHLLAILICQILLIDITIFIQLPFERDRSNVAVHKSGIGHFSRFEVPLRAMRRIKT